MPATELRKAASSFLDSDERQHLVGVAFLSHSELEPGSEGNVSSGGTTYFFPRKEGPMWAAEFSEIFQVPNG
jgi:hypothetical protein